MSTSDNIIVDHDAFVLEKKQTIPEIDSTVYLYTHRILGCQVLALKNQDENKTFCVSFKTVPEDSTGVAHILEHSVLMGSKKYPIKDVFGEINKGGLMTFLNAMTGSDTTWYPFATRNINEYFNIMDVYCDVTFNPLLLKSTFEQEGWHHHLENPDESIYYMGVVFNEMKGAFSDPIRALFHHTFKSLMPESTYAHESGGAPEHIPELTYEQFTAFHQAHYHPSNCTFFFYGNAPLEEELDFIQDKYLAGYTEAAPKSRILRGQTINKPVYIDEVYPIQPDSDTQDKTFLAVSSSIGTVHDRKRNTAFQVIANILFNSDASPLKKTIIEAGLCKDFGGVFLPSSSYTTILMTYLVGSDAEKRDQFLDLYKKTLTQMVESSIDRDLVLSELNKYEFSVREEMNKAQRGLNLIGKALPMLKHDILPFDALQIETLFAAIRKEATESNLFEELIKEFLLENPATVAVTLRPDPDKQQQNMAAEQKRLDAFTAALNVDKKEALVKRTRELMELQTTPNSSDDMHCLPHLSIDDLDRQPPFHVLQLDTLGNTKLLVSELDTNSVSYLDFGLDCSSLTEDLLPYLDIFGTLITEIGTADKGYMQFAKEINLYTGGFSHSFNTYIQPEDPDAVKPILWLHVKTLSSYLDKTVDLLHDVFASVDFSNRQRIQEIVQREYAWAEHSIQSEGYPLASTRVFSHLSKAGQYNEYVNGIVSYLKLKELAQNYAAGEEAFLSRLATLRDHLFRRQGLIAGITAGATDIKHFRQKAQDLPATLAAQPLSNTRPQFAPTAAAQAFCTSSEIVYNVQGFNLFPDPSRYNGSFEVLKTWISRDYLWNSVRQMGGAYGCFVQFNHRTGNFGMVSYRDPQVKKTYDTYDSLHEKIATLDLPAGMLNQLVIGTYGNFTPHQGPATLGATARNEYLSGITPEFKQQRIEEIIGTGMNGLREFAPLFAQQATTSYRATIGNTAKIEENKNLFDEILAV